MLVELSVVEQRYQAVLAVIRDGVPVVEVAWLGRRVVRQVAAHSPREAGILRPTVTPGSWYRGVRGSVGNLANPCGINVEHGIVHASVGADQLRQSPFLALRGKWGTIVVSASRRKVVALSVAAIAATALVMGTAPPSIAASSSPTVRFTDVSSTSTGYTVVYTVNRQAKAIASQTCTLTHDGSTQAAPCGSLKSDPKASPATFSVTLNNLAGTYAYTVSVALTDGGRASASQQIVADPGPLAVPDNNYVPGALGEYILGNVLNNDSSPTGLTLTVTSVGTFGLAHGTLTINASGVYKYTVTDSASSVSDEFLYTISDSLGRTASSTLTIYLTSPTT